jgi:hypothetical protein
MTLREEIFEAALGRTGSWSQADLITDDIMTVVERAPTGVWAETAAERTRAHQLHGSTSMEELPELDMCRLSILVEEVGEVAKEFNEARHNGKFDVAALRKELVQVAAMAGAWADVLR